MCTTNFKKYFGDNFRLAVLLSVLFISLISCTKNKAIIGSKDFKKLELAFKNDQKERINQNDSIQKMALSSELPAKGICLKNRNTNEILRAEIKEMEASEQGEKVTGAWQNMDLSKMPNAQALYLKKYSKFLQTEGVDFKGCVDLICALSRIYNDPTERSALLHYYWYLKMGYVLSASSDIPDLAKINVPYKEFLFRPDELEAFWLLSNILSTHYRNISFLDRIHRFPNGYKPSGSNAAGQNNLSFIINGGATSSNIWMMDTGLLLDYLNKQDLQKNYFYAAVTHEIAHSLDYSVTKNKYRISEADEWLSLSGWWIDELVQPDGALKRQWRIKKDQPDLYDSFVRDYGASSPREDWADTASYFRVKPEDAVQKSPRKSYWISKNIFNGRSFDQTGLLDYYKQFSREKISENILELVNKCLVNQNSYSGVINENNHYELKIDFAIENDVKTCIENGVLYYYSLAVNELRANEYEACDYFDKNNQVVLDTIALELNSDLTDILSKQSLIGEQLKAVKSFREQAEFNLDPREYYLACVKEQNSNECYVEKFKFAIEELANPFKLQMGSMYEDEIKRYLVTNNFQTVNEELQLLIENVFKKIDTSLNLLAEKHWSYCLTSKDSMAEGQGLLLSPFAGEEHFISKNILNCINTRAEGDIHALKDNYLRRISFSFASEQANGFAYDYLLGKYLKILNQLSKLSSKQEELDRAKLKNSVLNYIKEAMVTDYEWMGPYPRTQASTEANCMVKSVELLSNHILDLVKQDKIKTNFIAVEDLANEWSPLICIEIYDLEPIQNIFTQDYNKRWQEALSLIDTIKNEFAEQIVAKCFEEYPNKTTAQRLINKRSRRNCVKSHTDWLSLYPKVLEKWQLDPIAKEFSNRVSEVRLQIFKINITEIKDYAIKKLEELENTKQ